MIQPGIDHGSSEAFGASISWSVPQPCVREKHSNSLTLGTDGGGIRGLSAIMIIEDIMKGINQTRDPEYHLKPYQVFDLIGGTSTGG